MTDVSRSSWDNSVIVIRDGNVDSTWDGKIKSLVYNPITMAWEAATQATGGAGGGGDASAANQLLGNTSLSSIDTKLTSQATAANQTTEIAKLTSILAKQPALGAAGTASADVITVQGVASMTPIKMDGSAVTQPVSGTVAVSNFPASQAVTGTFWQSTQPVSGTFWQATRPVSIASMPSTPVTGTFWQATQPVSGTVTANAGTGSFTVAQATPANLQATVTQLAITKGTQGATGVTTQDLKDAGRTNVSLTAEAVAGAASEALITLTQSKAFATATTGTSYTVTAGKTLRLTALSIAFVSTSTTANTTRIRIRVNTAGAAALTSPICYDIRVGWPSATFIANESSNFFADFPDGIEIPAGSGVGITHLEAAANGTVDVSLVGFEY